MIIPWIDGAAWVQEISLSGRTYEIQVHWNEISQTWGLNLSDVDGEILNGISLVANQPFLYLHQDSRLPPGELFVLGNQTPGFDSFQNNESFLVYLE